MKQKHLLSLLQSGYTTIQVTFELANAPAPLPAGFKSALPQARQAVQTYTYKAKGEIKVGDAVIVDTPKRGLSLAYVVNVDDRPNIDTDADFSYKWIVQRVDLTEYNQLVEQERGFMETMQEIERARQREKLVKDFTDHLPEGSDARKLFMSAVSKVGATLTLDEGGAK